MPKWKELWLPEPEERVREPHVKEAERLDEAMGQCEDYAPLFDFARVTGKARANAIPLRWDQVHWDTGWIEASRQGRTHRAGKDHAHDPLDLVALARPSSRVRVHLRCQTHQG
jgi:hypothetical protein